MGFMRDVTGNYISDGAVSELDILEAAEHILHARLVREAAIGGPEDTVRFLRMRLGALEREEFHTIWLDNRHRVLSVEQLFVGTVDGASVHPREVVKAALKCNAVACIFAHNHPSGIAEPSLADRSITRDLVQALKLIEVRVLDHFVVTAGDYVSLAQRGLL